MFDLLGYRSVFSPFGDTVRRSLHGFFEDGGGLRSAERHFSDFRNAVKFAFPSDRSGNLRVKPLGFDTLTNRELIFHKTLDGAGILFAVTCFFVSRIA